MDYHWDRLRSYLRTPPYARRLGDDKGYFAVHKGVYFPIEFNYEHCYWYCVKYSDISVTTCDVYAIFSLLIAFSHDSGGVITFTFPHIS
jgi:hypothetical protein